MYVYIFDTLKNNFIQTIYRMNSLNKTVIDLIVIYDLKQIFLYKQILCGNWNKYNNVIQHFSC